LFILIYVFQKSISIAGFTIRIIKKQPLLQESHDNQLAYETIKNDTFISEDISLSNIPNNYFGRFITIGFLILYLQKNWKD
jgi:hypothetical protein